MDACFAEKRRRAPAVQWVQRTGFHRVVSRLLRICERRARMDLPLPEQDGFPLDAIAGPAAAAN